MKLCRAGAVAAFAIVLAPAADAQSIMHFPTINTPPRIPNISASPGPIVTPHVNPGVATHVNPVVAPHANPGINVGHVTPVIRTPPPPTLVGRTVVRPQFPYLHTSPNLYPACEAAERGGDGDCVDVFANAAGNGSNAKHRARRGGSRRNAALAAANLLTVSDEIVAEIDGALTDEQADALARRHGLRRIGSEHFPVIDATIGLFRITDGRAFETASREFSGDVSVRSVQPNYRYFVQEQKAKVPAEGDPAQYVLAKMRLPEAHTLARGTGIKVAVIDSGIDVRHRELAGSVIDSFDALGSSEGPHVHGTGIAGAIVAHARLMGSAPAAQLIAIRAFSGTSNGAQSNSFVILKSLDYAFRKEARIINMSFAGPKDPLIERGINAVAAKGITMVAAAGNGGAKSPPLYPAANPNVIAVSATDARDHLFAASNRGSYIALAAPGSDVFLPAPEEKYQVTSGTSFSAAFVSGAAALMLQRNLALKPEELRAILLRTARDLGSPGRDDLFGAGEADAYAAVQAVIGEQSAPVASTSSPPGEVSHENSAEQHETQPVRALAPQVSTAASEKPASAAPHEPAER
ncbi:MAG TPA: S8 family serine peptidase [Bradyrhizobium sp.]|uniref:S8 family serine peptidase n=1 Tax=Bradyrhizobium sp. TaxID=376 RepID=UPI002B77B389|nr:S8 family serine peptidase [Bradyrhizobium sp.]HLZ05536.1 S8 family serine peptidase [Bradyrhizobium sp.]